MIPDTVVRDHEMLIPGSCSPAATKALSSWRDLRSHLDLPCPGLASQSDGTRFGSLGRVSNRFVVALRV